MNKKVTLADLAEKAGVSMMTASRAINNKGDIHPKTRERILTLAAELGYRPNTLARGLATSRSSTIGVVLPDISNPFFSEITRGIEDRAHQAGYNVFVCNFDENIRREQNAIESLAEKQVDGLILCSSRQDENDLLESIRPFQRVVLINRSPASSINGVASINLADEAGARQAVDHLLRHGKTHIAYLAGPARSRSAQARLSGYRQALQAGGLTENPDLIIHCQPDMASGKSQMHMLLQDQVPLDAVLAFNDLIAIGALQACLENEVSVPSSLEIIGFDDIPLASLVHPALTTLAYPKKAIGAQAMDSLLSMLSSDQPPSIPQLYPPELIIRQTSPR